MFTISYTIAVITPIICGALWDITGCRGRRSSRWRAVG